MKYFGTDGIRGRVGETPITAEFVLRLGWAAGTVLAAQSDERCKVVIGKDTRLSGYMFESALEAGLASAGVDVLLLGPMPTPAIAHLTRSLGGVAGIVISASHNAYEDNGIKFFSGEGMKLDDGLQSKIEAALEQPMSHVAPHRLGRAARVDDAVGRYIEYCKGTVTWGTRFEGLKVVLDCANGATYRIAPEVFRELGADVVSIHNQPNGLNINASCGSTHPESLADRVIAEKADLGIAFDGDGDRVVMVDHQGQLIDGDQILFLLASARRSTGQFSGGVVGTVMSNFGLEEAFAAMDVPFARSKVGDRHVHELLAQKGWVLGGETSGHILCLDRASTGCGIVSALQVVEVVAGGRQSLAHLVSGMHKYPQVMINVPVQGNAREVVESDEAVAAALASAEDQLKGQGRVILRPSGTEPVVRVTVEGRDAMAVQTLAEELADVVAGAVTS
jgi:phosphoglucosamine mutase